MNTVSEYQNKEQMHVKTVCLVELKMYIVTAPDLWHFELIHGRKLLLVEAWAKQQ